VKFQSKCMNFHCKKRKLGFPNLNNTFGCVPKYARKMRAKIKVWCAKEKKVLDVRSVR
jgi:hypothetical protein